MAIQRNVRGAAQAKNVSTLDPDLLGLTGLGAGEPRGAEYTGIKALMLAVLENGIANYLSPVARSRAEAECWVTTRQRSPFCFRDVCETLGLEPDAVRAALRRWRATRVSHRQAIGRTRPNVHRTTRLLPCKGR